jgi:triphosphoribosyl-dephospho-CoA synthase
MVLSRQLIRTAYEDACRQEIEALKPGNVHVFADGHRMSAEQFLTSARVSSGPLTDPGLSVGQRILKAVSATRQAVGTNTNLGILLLSAPLARAAEMPGQIRDNLATVLDGMDMADADAVFRAIVLAEPGGLGSAEQHDVRDRPKVPLLEAMRTAAGRDSIARQYAGGFDEVFSIGVVALDAGQGESGMWPTIRAYLAFLIAFPDSHVARKHGPQIAETVRADAAATRAALDGAADDDARIALLRDFDRRLKAQGINPGTSADLTVASLFVRNLLRQLARADG